MTPRTVEVNGMVSPPPIPMRAKPGIRSAREAVRPRKLMDTIPAAITTMAIPTDR